ncbi:MAG: transcription antitermination factor NusB [Mycoplasma sp.]
MKLNPENTSREHKMKAQWEKRLAISNYIYQSLLLEFDKQTMILNASSTDEFDTEQLSVIEYIANNLESMIELIKPNLADGWIWERMSYVDRGIMLTAIAEVKVLETPKVIAIDQALISAKNLNIDESYKYINAVLDKVIK